jgi:nanoRNase/pAp phosphatase (c-di-AMP/oligoRNAs hydrolase)
MDLTAEAASLKQLLMPSPKDVTIILPDQASRDAIAAGLALYLSLTQAGNKVSIAYPRPIIVGWSHLIGINKITPNLGSKNFVISLDYVEGSIEKVSYNIESNKFNLVIEPRPGAVKFSDKNVSYSYSGIAAELVVTVSAITKEALGKYYIDNKTIFDTVPLVVIDNKATNTQYGKLNIVRPTASISELVTQVLQQTLLPLDNDIASNLYDGILSGSRNFNSDAVTADTFDSAAFCLRNGAKKPQKQQEETPRQEFGYTKPNENLQAPPDWLKPKIFKGGSLL